MNKNIANWFWPPWFIFAGLLAGVALALLDAAVRSYFYWELFLYELRHPIPDEFFKRLAMVAFCLALGFFVQRIMNSRRVLAEELEEANEKLEERIEERTRELVRKSEDLATFRQAMNMSEDAIFLLDAHRRRLVDINDAASKKLGYGREELLALGPEEFVPEEDYPVAQKVFDDVVAGRAEGGRIDVLHRRKDGSVFPMEMHFNAMVRGGRRLVIAVGRDVSERRAYQRRLEEERELLETLLNGLKAAFLILDRNTGAIEEMNAVAEELMGFSLEKIKGLPCDQIFRMLEVGPRHISSCPEGEKEPAPYEEGQLTRLDGKVTPVSKSVFPVRWGGRDCWAQVFFDISERQALERQLSVAQKMESIGQLAAGIAHEINTPTQYVGDLVRFLQDACTDMREMIRKLEERMAKGGAGEEFVEFYQEQAEAFDLDFLDEETPKALSMAQEGVERITRIVQAMKKFSHPGAEEKRAVDINAALDNTATVAKNEWKYVAEMAFDLDPDLPPVPCLPGDMNQVFLNLLVNGAHAIGEKVKNSHEKGMLKISSRVDGDWAEVRIGDSGTGIPEENRHKIFDPFFTTKEVGKGTGQGLSIAYNIVDKHGGTISFETEEGVGTTFIIRLPLHPPDMENSEEAS
ncbi:MAG: PAS domain S-box protein [Desulfovibrionaceae bacterium]